MTEHLPIVFHHDRFNGIYIDVSEQTVELSTFADKLKGAVDKWSSEGRKGLWIKVTTDKSFLIPQLVELGLEFHHAKPGYATLTKWMAPSVPNHMPGYATHYVGVAGFVVNSSNQILAIQEQYHVRNNINMWKLPGGLAEPGEELMQTAQREVFEETGVRCEFLCVLAFRHMHGYRHGCSDFYFVCLMRPLTLEINPCPQEIAACQWMDLEEYENSGLSEINKYFVKIYRDYLATGVSVGGREILSYDKVSFNYVYSGCKVMQKTNQSEENSSGQVAEIPQP